METIQSIHDTKTDSIYHMPVSDTELPMRDMTEYVMNMWDIVKRFPIFRSNIELAEYMIESDGMFSEVCNIVDDGYTHTPLDIYTDVVELAAAMMVLIQPMIRGAPMYKYAYDMGSLSEIYSDPFMQLIYIRCAMSMITRGMTHELTICG